MRVTEKVLYNKRNIHVSGPQLNIIISILRSSRPEVFYKRGALKNFAKFTVKHLCQSLFFNKVAGLRSATLLKKSLWHRRFPVNFAKFLTTPFLIEHGSCLWNLWNILWSNSRLQLCVPLARIKNRLFHHEK